MLERSTKALLAGAALVASTVAYAPLAGAANDSWLQLDNIKGDSRSHKGAIDFLSFSWGAANPTSPRPGGGANAGKASLAQITIMKQLDGSSNDLLKNVMTGQSIRTAVFNFAKAVGGQTATAATPYLKITLQDAYVNGVQWSSGGDVPMESVSFAFARIGWAYTALDEQGRPANTVKGGWDVTTSQPWTAP